MPQIRLKPVRHIGAMNNTSSAVLNFKTWFTACVHVPNPSFISKRFLPLYFQTLSKNPSFISISFLPLYFRTLSQNPSFNSIRFYLYISVHCPKTRAKPGVLASTLIILKKKKKCVKRNTELA